jgi:hypothetical protein
MSPAGVPVVFCAKCGGARTGRTGCLVKSCVLMCAAGAARDRLKRLGEGKHPYKAYNYHIQVLGQIGVSWAMLEQVPVSGMSGSAPPVVGPGGLGGTIFGQEASVQEEAALLKLLRDNGEELEAHLLAQAASAVECGGPDEDGDPFGFGGDFDSA